jgi:hypothetical protein
MNDWMRRIGGVAAMGLVWAAAWVPVGAFIGTMDLAASADRLWVPVAQPGFLCGALFAAAIRLTGGRLARMSLVRCVAWGAPIGLFVGSLPFAISQPSTDLSLWLLGVEIIGPVTALSTVSAIASVLTARVAAKSAFRGSRASVG